MKINFPDNLTEEQKKKVITSQKFKNYIKGLREDYLLKEGTIRDIIWFGVDKPGMILFEANKISTKDGRELSPTVTLIRGNSSAIMPVLENDNGDLYTVVLSQARIATGNKDYYEIPAGMVDEGEFKNTALRELEEETGLHLDLKEKDLHLIKEFYPSPGGSDEKIAIYYFHQKVSNDILNSLINRQTGLKEEGEHITTHLIRLDELPQYASNDGKSIMAYSGYQEIIKYNQIPLKKPYGL